MKGENPAGPARVVLINLLAGQIRRGQTLHAAHRLWQKWKPEWNSQPISIDLCWGVINCLYSGVLGVLLHTFWRVWVAASIYCKPPLIPAAQGCGGNWSLIQWSPEKRQEHLRKTHTGRMTTCTHAEQKYKGLSLCVWFIMSWTQRS